VAVTDNVSGLSLGYEFDAVGNLLKLRNASQTDPPLATYVYDGLNRLADTKDGPTGTVLEHYGYDATGNRTSLTHPAGVTTTYGYSGTSHRLDSVGATARSYDAAGNTTQIGGTAREFVYSDAGRMSQVKAGGVVTLRYVYNGRGEQVRKYTGTTSTYTVYDEAGHWLGDYDTAGNPIQQVVWMDDLPVGLMASNGLNYVEADALGTPRAVIDPERNVAIWKWDLTGEAFGNTAPNQNPDGDANAFLFNMRFPGQRYDAASGLNYNYFRDYESTTGRYTQSDPIGLDGGISTYGYVHGSPLIYGDPFGLVNHSSGQWIDCGKGCRIRIDFTFDSKTGRKTRHLHWECKNSEGECGEFGAPSHKGSWADAPRSVQECAVRNGFQGAFSEQPNQSEFVEIQEMSPGAKVVMYSLLFIGGVAAWVFGN